MDVTKSLGGFRLEAHMVVEGLTCLVGKNGSGKTTLINIIAGFYRPDSGAIFVDGVDVTHVDVHRRGIAVVNHNSYLANMDVDAHITYGMRLRGLSVDPRTLVEAKRALGIDYTGKVGSLSLGMKMRVALCTALLSGCKSILVDEAFSTLDDSVSIIKTYRQLALERGIDVLYATQSRDEAEVADTVYLMEGGAARLIRSRGARA